MKLLVVSLVLASAGALQAPFGMRQAHSSSALYSGSRINDMVNLESSKVVHQEKLEAGEKKVYCRCWKSGTFPLCDASHPKHNEATGDNVGPLIVSCAKPKGE